MQIESIKKGLLRFDLESLQKSTAEMLKKFDIRQGGQLGFTHRRETLDKRLKVFESTGYHYNPSDLNYFGEGDFPCFNDDFKNTYFFEIYSKLPFKAGRMRLMLCAPKTCYSMHSDLSMRYHVAIHTNPYCYILFENGECHHIPEDGYLYKMDACKKHTALNAGDRDRIHLLINELPGQSEKLNPAAEQGCGAEVFVLGKSSPGIALNQDGYAGRD